jgi:NADPH-dependent curcumin reductase CurA
VEPVGKLAAYKQVAVLGAVSGGSGEPVGKLVAYKQVEVLGIATGESGFQKVAA